MINFYIGNSVEYIAVEYAKSGRSACKKCKQKIGKDQLRVGLLLDDDHFMASYWYHPDCFHFAPRHKILEVDKLEQQIYGIQDLDDKDCDKIVEQLKQQLKDFKEDKHKKTKTLKNNKSKAKQDKQIKQDKKQDKKQEQKKQTKKSVKSKSKSRSKSLSVVSEPNKTKSKKTKKTAPKQKKFLTAAQTKQYKDLLENYEGLTANELKQILGKNGQPKTGNKSEMAARCADGKQFGRIPTCNSCGGGKLRFDRTKGTYTCPGYMQDTDFVHCKAKFTFEEVKRLQWSQ